MGGKSSGGDECPGVGIGGRGGGGRGDGGGGTVGGARLGWSSRCTVNMRRKLGAAIRGLVAITIVGVAIMCVIKRSIGLVLILVLILILILLLTPNHNRIDNRIPIKSLIKVPGIDIGSGKVGTTSPRRR